ncbi:hypothetical protein C8F04DRAFT_916280, partial [Mycena alexandri]
EVCPKYNENGKLKQEMILVVCVILLALQHPTEYIRGATPVSLRTPGGLKLACIPPCRSCLKHYHIRKNTVFAAYAIYREFEHLAADSPELISTFLAAELDSTCKRDAFV